MEYEKTVQALQATYREGKICIERFPAREKVGVFMERLQELFFPEFFSEKTDTDTSRSLLELKDLLSEILLPVCGENSGTFAEKFIEKTPEILRKLHTDLQAFYEGDPAAKNREEIVLCYPGFYAIMHYRVAHELFLSGISYLPRMITERAHGKTGIDIHPGATIGEYFFIDHGTGIVIGETTEIGHHVRLYQGVTLGAKSFRLDESGNPVKGGKRHPTIGNGVIIYANATILGGKTVVGDGCVIGGNVWLTESVDAGKTVYYIHGEK